MILNTTSTWKRHMSKYEKGSRPQIMINKVTLKNLIAIGLKHADIAKILTCAEL